MHPPPVRAPPETVVPDVWTFTPVAASYTVLGRALWASTQRGFLFAPPLRCAGPRVMRPCLSPVGRAHLREHCDNSLRARRTGFYHGSELPVYLAPALRFASVLRRNNRRTSSGEEGKGLEFC